MSAKFNRFNIKKNDDVMLCRETTQPMTMACKKRVALLARMGFVWQMAAWTDLLFGRVRGRNQSPASIFK